MPNIPQKSTPPVAEAAAASPPRLPHEAEQQLAALVALTRGRAWLEPDEETGLREITETVARALQVERASLWRWNTDHTAIICRSLFTASAGRHSSGQQLGTGLFPAYFRALAESEVIAADDARQDPRTREFAASYLEPLGITSMLDTPVLVAGKPAGVLCLEHVGAGRRWTPAEQSFAVSVANLVSLMLSWRAQAQSEAALRAIVESEPECVKIVAADGRLLDMNPAGLRLLDIDRESEVVGRPVADFVHPEDRPAFMDLHRRACGGATGQLQFRIIGLRGSEHWVETHSTPLREPDGTITSVLSVTHDITARRNTEETLRASMASMAAAQRIAHFGSWELELADLDNLNANPLRWSDEMFRIAGFEPGAVAVTSELFFRLVPPAEHAVIREAVAATIREGRPYSLIHRLIRPDGAERIVHETAELTLDERTRRPLKLIGTANDITERKRAEDERDRLFNLSLDLLCVAGFDGRLQQVNPAWTECLGWSAAELTGQPMLDFILPEDHEATLRVRERIHRGEPVRGFENRYRCKDGSHRWLSWSVHPLTESRQVFAVARDVTESKRAQRHAAIFADLGSRLSGSTTVEDSARVIMEAADKLFGWDACWLHLHDAATGLSRSVLNLDLVDGLRQVVPPAYQDAPPSPLVQDVIREGGKLILRGEPAAVPDQLIPYGSTDRRSASLMIVPVRHAGETIAVLSIQSYTPNAYAAADLAGLQALADYCAGVFERIRAIEALRRSEQEQRRLAEELELERARLAAAQRVAKVGSWETNLATLAVIWSEETHRIFETDPATFQPSHRLFLEFVHPEDRARVDEAFFRSLDRPEPEVLEHRIQMPDGRIKFVEERWQVFHNARGEPLRALGTCRDVTEHHAAVTEIRRTHDLLRAVADSTTDAVFVKDRQGRYLLFNEAAARFVGRPVEDVLGRDDTALFSPEDARVIQESDRRVMESNQVHTTEEVLTAAGVTRTYLATKAPYRDGDGHVIGLVGISRDITTRMAAEARIRENEERFRLLSRATNDAIWDWDLVTNALWWNEGFETLFGFARAEVEVTIESWTNRIHPDDHAAVVADVHRAIDGGAASWSGEYRFRRKDGSYAYVLDRGHVIRDAQGKPVRMIGGMTDLSARKQAEARIAEQAALLDKAQDAILVRDLEHRVTYWNKSAERLYGWTAAETLGRPVQELLYQDATPFLAAMDTVLSQGEWVGEIEQRSKQGRRLIIEGRWTLVRDDQGNPKAVLAINTDLTERKKIEQQFLRAQRMESIGTLAGGIAHDLNNVLAPILMSLQMLRELVADREVDELVATLESSAQRGSELVKQVLSFARGIEGERVPVNVLHLARDIEKIVHETFPKNLAFTLRSARELWTVTGDPTQLHQVLMNLCVNARDAMPHGGQLGVRLENVVLDEVYAGMNPDSKPGNHLMIEVADTGTGIPAEVQDRIFEPFFTTKETGRGTGLGLSTSLGIVRSHGGFINLESQEGRGSTFRVYLPASPVAGAAENNAPARNALPRGHGELVLVVDDEEGVRRVAQKTLERYGYRVLLAANGAEAVALYAQRRAEISLVLTDMAMPVMDGPATIIALKALNPRVKIVGSSGLATHEDVAQLTGAGVQHFVPKPYTADTMLKTFAQVLQGRD